MPTEMQIQLWLADVKNLDREITRLVNNKDSSLAYTLALEKTRQRDQIVQRLKEAGVDAPTYPIKETP